MNNVMVFRSDRRRTKPFPPMAFEAVTSDWAFGARLSIMAQRF
jgi:hypothetical protein